jgi:hypothetical protein
VALIDHDRAMQSRESAQPSDECGIFSARHEPSGRRSLGPSPQAPRP